MLSKQMLFILEKIQSNLRFPSNALQLAYATGIENDAYGRKTSCSGDCEYDCDAECAYTSF